MPARALPMPPPLPRRCVSYLQLLECQFQANSRCERRTAERRTDGPTKRRLTAVLHGSFGLSLPSGFPKIAEEFLGECYF